MPNKGNFIEGISDWFGQLKDDDDPVHQEIYASWKTWLDEVGLKESGLQTLSGLLKYGQTLDGVSDWLRQKTGQSSDAELAEIKARLDTLEALVRGQKESAESPENGHTGE